MNIAVVGLGKVGLPLAAQFARKGHVVVGVDINAATVATINEGEEPFPGEANLLEELQSLVPSGRLRATTSYADAIPDAGAVVVIVPLFVDADGRPDFTSLDAATTDIASHLTPGTLVAYETTLPVGTTRTRWKPLLEKVSGLTEGQDFHVAFSPERVLTGRVFEDLRKYPKLIGALSHEGAQITADFYESVLDFDCRPELDRGNGVWDLGSAEAAEMAKLAETTYRDVNIGLANQFALFAESAGIDVHRVIDAANSQPYSHIHRPGVSVGGHCLPVYPRLYLANDPHATIVRSARDHNAAQPRHAASLLERTYGSLAGARVVVLGAAYRAGTAEAAHSGVFDLVRELEQVGALVSVHDPHVTTSALAEKGLRPHALGTTVDAAILHTDHREYDQLTSSDLPGARLILDGRNSLRSDQFEGVELLRLGVGSTRQPG